MASTPHSALRHKKLLAAHPVLRLKNIKCREAHNAQADQSKRKPAQSLANQKKNGRAAIPEGLGGSRGRELPNFRPLANVLGVADRALALNRVSKDNVNEKAWVDLLARRSRSPAGRSLGQSTVLYR